jgi:hypothetical protein
MQLHATIIAGDCACIANPSVHPGSRHTYIAMSFEERFSDHHPTGPEQEVRYEISVSELVQLIRAHGARL